jgi:hypothetical protein
MYSLLSSWSFSLLWPPQKFDSDTESISRELFRLPAQWLVVTAQPRIPHAISQAPFDLDLIVLQPLPLCLSECASVVP